MLFCFVSYISVFLFLCVPICHPLLIPCFQCPVPSFIQKQVKVLEATRVGPSNNYHC